MPEPGDPRHYDSEITNLSIWVPRVPLLEPGRLHNHAVMVLASAETARELKHLPSPECLSPLIPPQHHAAQQPALIRDNTHVFCRCEEDLFRVAAAQVEVIPVEELLGLRDRRL